MPRSLKVFRTPIGFHDAYIAAPSRKAALKAWGSDADLFARGAAEQVSDPALMAEPLAHPGEIIRRARGSIAEHLAALPKDAVADRPSANAQAKKARRPAPPKPRPSRKYVEALETGLEEARRLFEVHETRLREREQALAAERRQLADAYDRDLAEQEAALEKAQQLYAKQMEDWRE